jgi:transposase-like protein
MEYTTIKIPRLTYEAAKKLQAELAKRGINNLPPQLKSLAESSTCPFCHTQMEGFEVSFYKCKKCGYSRQRFNVSSSEADDILRALALGAIIVLGIAAIAELLGRK